MRLHPLLTNRPTLLLSSLAALFGLTVAPQAHAAVVTVPVNADGTFGTNVPGTDIYEITVYEGDTVKWTNLGPTDSIVQIGAAPSAGMNLCEDPALARPYNVHSPAAPGEITGPFKTSPAGIIALSPNDCGMFSVPLGQPCTNGTWVMDAGAKSLCSYDASVCDPASGGDIDLKYRVMEETWANPDIDGVFLRLDWKDLHTGPGSFNFSYLDRELHLAAKYGKVAVIGVRVGSNSMPDWVFDEAQTGAGLAVTAVELKDGNGGSQSFPGATCGTSYTLASPSDLNFRMHFTDLISEMGAYLSQDTRLFHHVAGVKVTGLGLETLENRAPKRCNIKDPATNRLVDAADPFVNGANPSGGLNYLYPTLLGGYSTVNAGATCECNPQIWADAGYKPSELYRFYRYVEDAIESAFVYKAKIFMLIQEGFPQVGESGGYEGDTLAEYDFANGMITQSSVAGVDYPFPTEQTTTLLAEGRDGRWVNPELGTFSFPYNGRSFVASHQALERLPQDVGLAACSQQAAIDTAPGVNLGSPVFPNTSPAGTGSSCPNKWAANEGLLYGQNTGFQTTNSILTAVDVDSTLWNLTANTNGTYYENYEKVFWRLANEVSPGSGPGRAVLDATPAIAGGVAKNLNTWGKVLRYRRSVLAAQNVNNTFITDPYPTIWQRYFSTNLAPGQVQYSYYINPRVCGGATPSRSMRIKYIGR